MAKILTVTIPLDLTDILSVISPGDQKQVAIEYAADLIVRKVENDLLWKQLETLSNNRISDIDKTAMLESYTTSLNVIRAAIPKIEYDFKDK